MTSLGTLRAQERSQAPAATSLRYMAVGVAALLLVLGLPLLAGSYEPYRPYYRDVLFSTGVWGVLWALFSRFPAAGDRVYGWATRYNVAALAILSLLVSTAAALFVFDGIPHVSDEVAYQFQARALAAGQLAVAAPAEPDFFDFLHTIVDGDWWYGIMNPGWPAILAIGQKLNAPWLVNPILGALTLLVFYAFFQRAGYGRTESRIALLLMALSPLVLFMSATLMAHTANLLLFGIFLWAWTRIFETRAAVYPVIAGAALGINLLVRPIDAGMVALPFIIQLCYRALRDRRLIPHVVLVGAVAASGIGATMLYNQALTGDARVMPMTKYFMDRDPGQKFGMGFGADMGTTLHGEEWPGYYPADAVRVTSYRLAELFRDLHYLPLILAAALLLPLAFREYRQGEWHRLLLLSGVSLLVVYVFHFYHGIAYGSRHYFLAIPAMSVALARPLGRWLDSADRRVAMRARAALAAGLLFVLSYPYVRLLPVYDGNYRGASANVREAVESRDLANAVVFVEEGNWAWKSAFPLNDYPLESNNVIFARDLGAENTKLLRQYADRSFYSLRVKRGRVEIERLATP